MNDVPPGWDYNPAAWSQRIPIVVLAAVGFLLAAYLALYQYRVVEDVWEPFFGRGSEIILNSPTSHLFPVSDAALGAFGYLLDAATGLIGGRNRWRTMPWMVVLFGVLIGPLGAVSLALVVIQPVVYEAWCTICLATAVISTLMIGPALDEVLASLQHLKRARREGRSVWRVFWGTEQVAPKPQIQNPKTSAATLGAAAQVVACALGIWLMAAPDVLGYRGAARINDLVIGPVAASIACVAIWEVARPLRWMNLVLGGWMAIAPAVLGFGGREAANAVLSGLVLCGLSLIGGRRTRRFDGRWKMLVGS